VSTWGPLQPPLIGGINASLPEGGTGQGLDHEADPDREIDTTGSTGKIFNNHSNHSRSRSGSYRRK